MTIVLVMSKNSYSVWLFFFLERHVHSKNKQLLLPPSLIFLFLKIFLIKLFLISTFETYKIKALNKWIRPHITEERAKAHKKWPNLIFAYIFSLIFHKKIYLGSSLLFTLFWESHNPTELIQTLTVTHKHRMQKSPPQMD